MSDLVAKAALESKRLAAQRQEESDEEEEGDTELPKVSKKKLRRMNRLSVAQLKQLVERPDVVEMHDVTAPDPQLLIHLKVGFKVQLVLDIDYNVYSPPVNSEHCPRPKTLVLQEKVPPRKERN